MPFRKGYKRGRRTRAPVRSRALVTRGGNNRRRVARVIRPLTMRPVSAVQKLVYTNTFQCTPGLSAGQQQNFNFQILLNSPWMFAYDWNDVANLTGQSLIPNEAITPVPQDNIPLNSTTIMPGVREGGGQPFDKYQNGYVTGTKVTVVATPINNEAGTPIQLGYLYAHKGSQAGSRLAGDKEITDLNKLPFVQMRKLMGNQQAALQTASSSNSSRLTIFHSPKKWNNVKDLKDNKQFAFNTKSNSGQGNLPGELDFLSIGVIPALNSYTTPGASAQTKCTNFQLQLRIEQSILWTEPLDQAGTGTGNLAYPVPASQMNNFASGMYRATRYMTSRY